MIIMPLWNSRLALTRSLLLSKQLKVAIYYITAMLIRFPPISSFLLMPLPFSIALAPTRQVYRFSRDTFLENIAVRPSGSLLVTVATAPDLYLVNPSDPVPQPVLVHRFSEALATLGITETSPDTFYLTVVNATLSHIIPSPKSTRIYRVSFPRPDEAVADVRLVATVLDAGLLNGLTPLDVNTILAADSSKGAVHAIDVASGTSRMVLQDPLMAPLANFTGPGFNLGINGVHVRDNHLYFTNTVRALFARIAINADGTSAGAPATIISNAPSGTGFDDFALGWSGRAFAAVGAGNTIYEIGPDGRQEVIAGGLNSTEVAEPTSVVFGKGAGWGKLFVTTAGGLGVPVNGDAVVGGQVVEIDLRASAEGFTKG